MPALHGPEIAARGPRLAFWHRHMAYMCEQGQPRVQWRPSNGKGLADMHDPAHAHNGHASNGQVHTNGRAHRDGIERPYDAGAVERLRGSVRIDYALARLGANRLRDLLAQNAPVTALGVVTG